VWTAATRDRRSPAKLKRSWRGGAKKTLHLQQSLIKSMSESPADIAGSFFGEAAD